MASDFGVGFARGFGTVAAVGQTYQASRKFGLVEEAAKLELETARGELEDFKKFSDFSRELSGGIQAEGQRLESSRAANQMSGKLLSGLALTEPRSPERRLAVDDLPTKIKPPWRRYFTTATGESLQGLHQTVTEDDDFGVEQLKRVLTHPGAAGEAITRASGQARAREADPAGYGFQIQMKLLGGKAEKLDRVRARAWQVYSQMRPGSKAQGAMENMIAGIDRQLTALETQRNNLSSPQFSTYARGAEQVTQLVDPQSGELIQVGAAEAPVYIQQRGQDVRSALARQQSERQFQQREGRARTRARSAAHYEMLSPEEVKAYGLAAGTTAQRNLKSGHIATLQRPAKDSGAAQAIADEKAPIYPEIEQNIIGIFDRAQPNYRGEDKLTPEEADAELDAMGYSDAYVETFLRRKGL